MRVSKLLKIKKWLTLDEAAKYLSGALSEPVSVKDILLLALDGHLTLSVYVVGGILAKVGRAIPKDQAKKVPGIPIKGMPEYEVTLGVPINETEVLTFDDQICSIDGVFDLPMIGGECATCQAMYQKLTNGPDVDLTSIDGTFLRAPDMNRYFSLHEEYLPKPKMGDKRNVWERRNEVVQFPIGNLPRDSVFVLRIEVLASFLEGLNSFSENEKPLGARERNNLLNIIGALVDVVLGVDENGKPRSVYRKQESIINDLIINHGDKDGISKSNLELKFAASNRSLNSD